MSQQQPHYYPQQTHDLHFSVQNGDGSSMPPHMEGSYGHGGSMDHLPDQATQPSSATSANPSGGTLQYIADQFQQSAHPMVAVFHILFKLIALALYLLGNFFVKSGEDSGAQFITVTVICILLLAADFWVVKNVTGRLLVGLRWWNKVDIDSDSTEWIFESAESAVVNPFDRSFFWMVLYSTPVIWMVLFVFDLLRLYLKWLLIVVMALALNAANVYGYYKCSSEQKARFQQMMQQGAQQGALAMMRSNMLGLLTGTMSGPKAGGGGGGSSNTYV